MNDPALKALHLALAPSAGDGESSAAALGFLRIARNRGWSLDDLRDALGGYTRPPPKPEPPWGWGVEMKFGKYRGLKLGAIALRDPGYLSWLLTIDIDDYLGAAVEGVLDHLRKL